MSLLRTRMFRVAAVAATGAFLVPVFILASPVAAAPGDTSVFTFDYTGTPQSFTVPTNATELTIDIWGGDGGSTTGADMDAAGGTGSHLTFTVPVSGLGSTLEVRVGGNGESYNGPTTFGAAGRAGGWNGGGSGGTSGDGQPGAGGGGRSEVLDGATVLGVAGGGGGAGGSNVHPGQTGEGGDAGASVSATSADGSSGGVGDNGQGSGGGGTASAGGAGGSGYSAGASGVAGTGGNGGNATIPFHTAGAGGGGAGVFGGGGGGSDIESTGGGGGGGSSAVNGSPANVSFAASSLGFGRVTISWVEPDIAPAGPVDLQATAGDASINFTWSAPVPNGGTPVLGYTVTLAPGGATCAAAAPATTCAISGLNNGTSYTATLVASNAVGVSAPSAIAATPYPPAVSTPSTTAPTPEPTLATPPAEPAMEPAAVAAAEDVPESLAFTGNNTSRSMVVAITMLLIGVVLTRRSVRQTGNSCR